MASVSSILPYAPPGYLFFPEHEGGRTWTKAMFLETIEPFSYKGSFSTTLRATLSDAVQFHAPMRPIISVWLVLDM